MDRVFHRNIAALSVGIAAVLVSGTIIADTGASNPYLTLQLQKGQVYADLFSKAVEVQGEGFDPYVGRYSGSAAYKVLDPDPANSTFDEKYPALGKAEVEADVIRKGDGETWCHDGKCDVDRETSGLAFNPLLWGMPAGDLKLGQTWQVQVTEPWEIGPAGSETVKVVSLDAANGIVTLEREGSGMGQSQDDGRKLPITVQGKKVPATVTAGPSTWSGLTTIQRGIILNDEILIRRSVTLQTEAGTFKGEETEYTLLNLMPTTGISYPVSAS